jgi:hypothetical protein
MTGNLFRLAAILSCLVLIGAGAAIWPVRVVTVTLPKENNRQIASIRMGDKDGIHLTYRHSVELTTVEGRFKIGPGSEILAVETRMESVGTGLPNAHPERTRIEDGWLVVDEKERAVGPIRFYIVPLNETQLEIAGQQIDLTGLRPGILVQITAHKKRLLSWLVL